MKKLIIQTIRQVKPLLSTGGLALVKNVLLVLVSLISIGVLTRVFDKEIYGQMLYAMNIIGMLGIFSLRGAPVPLASAVSKGYHGTYRYLLKRVFPFLILGMLASVLLSLFFFRKEDMHQIGVILLLVSPLFLLKYFEYSPAFLAASGKYNFYLKRDIVASLSIALITLFTAWKSHSIIWYLVVNNTVVSIYFLYLFIFSKNFIENNKTQSDAFKNVLIYSAINIGFLLTSRLDKIIVANFISLAVLADYSIAYNMRSSFDNFLKQFLTPVFMKLSAKEVSESYRIVNRNIKLAFLLGLTGAVFYVFCVYILGLIVLPQKYDAGIRYAYFLSISIFCSPIVMLYYSILKYQLLPKLIIKSDSFLKLVKFAGFIVILPFWGVKGMLFIIVLMDIVSIFVYKGIIYKHINKVLMK